MKKGLKEREISCSEVIDFLKFRFVQNTFIVKSAFKWFIQPLLKWEIFILWSALCAFMTSVRLLHLIPHHPSLYCFYCLHQFFSVPPTFWNIDCNYSVWMAWNSDSLLQSSSKCGCRCLREPQLEVSQPLWKKKKSQSILSIKKHLRRERGRSMALWSLIFLCVVCNCGEEHVPLRNTPRLLQLMTAGGSSLGAVWQHLLRY